jgi:hypothetical protein
LAFQAEPAAAAELEAPVELVELELPVEVDMAELPVDTAELLADTAQRSADMVEFSARTVQVPDMAELWEAAKAPIAARSEPTVKSEIHYFGLKIREPILPTDIRRA